MLNLFLILAALTGLPAFTEVGRVLMSLLVRLIGLAFAKIGRASCRERVYVLV